MKNKKTSTQVRNKVIIEISVEELMKCRVAIGQLTPLFREMKNILSCLEDSHEETLASRIRKVCYDYRQTIGDINDEQKILPLLDSLFSYGESD